LPAFLLFLGCAGAVLAASVPRLESRGGDPLSLSDRATLAAWALAQPEVQSHVGASRLRFLRGGAELAKGEGGAEYRRAVLYYRNYDSGFVNEVEVNLETGEISVRDRADLIQPNQDEVEAALAVIARDPALAPLLGDASIHVDGGFYDRSPLAKDPCSKNVCLIIELMNAGHGNGWAHRVIVNLSRETIANRDFHGPTREGQIVPLTDLGGN